MRNVVLLTCAAITFAAAAAGIPRSPDVQIVRPPTFMRAGDVLVLQIRVAQHTHNRLLITQAVEDGVFVIRRSDEALEGADAPVTRWIRWRFPDPAILVLVAAVIDDLGHEVARDTAVLRVI